MRISDIIMKAVEYDCGDSRRINHFMKVYAYAAAIGEREGLCEEDMLILSAAAVLHDIGIHNAERLHGSNSGKYQELEGPPVASELLSALGCGEELISTVCDMVGRHHTYTGVDSLLLQILIEADFLVNICEDGMDMKQIKSVKEKIFKTASGISMLENIYEGSYLGY